jgi:hypothetical protein
MNCTAAARCLSIPAVLALLVAACGNAPGAQVGPKHRSVSAQAEGSIAITNVTLVDVVNGERQTATTLITKAGEIAGIGREISIPPGAVRVDGTGKFLIPGLWDMHSHNQASGAESLELYLANGVVGTRDMGSNLEFILPLRDRIRRGELSGPEIVAAGPMLDNAPADWPFRRRVTNAQEAREAVRDLKKRRVDFIKVHNNTPRDVFFAIADEAPKLGLSFAGHVPLAVTIDEGAASGIKSMSISQSQGSSVNVQARCSRTMPSAVGRCSTSLPRTVCGRHRRSHSFEFCLTCSPANRCLTPNMPAIAFSS